MSAPGRRLTACFVADGRVCSVVIASADPRELVVVDVLASGHTYAKTLRATITVPYEGSEKRRIVTYLCNLMYTTVLY